MGMRHILARVSPGATIEEAGTFEEVLALAEQGVAPVMFVLDLIFPGFAAETSIMALRRRFPRATLAVVSMADDAETVDLAMASGADGFVGKSIPPDEIATALAAIRDGEIVVGIVEAQPMGVAIDEHLRVARRAHSGIRIASQCRRHFEQEPVRHPISPLWLPHLAVPAEHPGLLGDLPRVLDANDLGAQIAEHPGAVGPG